MSRKLLIRKLHTNAWFNSGCYSPHPLPTPHPLRKVHHGNVFYMTFQSPLPGVQKRTISHPGNLNNNNNKNFRDTLRSRELHLNYLSLQFWPVETCIWRSVSSSLNVALESAAHFSGRISSIQTLVLLTFVETKPFWWLILQWQHINCLFRCLCRVQWNRDRKS